MKRFIRSQRLLWLFILSLLIVPDFALYAQTSGAATQVYRVNRRSQWQQWTFPAGTLDFGLSGSLTPARYKGLHNAALNVGAFTHGLAGGRQVSGGVWKAGSNEAAAHRIIDGDSTTFWQPDADAPLEDWWIEIDLGRATMVTEVRLIFPDEEGARPFREFRVFGSEGRRVTRNDVFSFHLIGGTTRPIEETLVSYKLDPLVREARRVRQSSEGVDDAGAATDANYDLVQFIRILVDAKTADAALAEVEVYTPGENIALGTLERGGTIQERAGRGFAFKMADGDANSDWGARRERGQDPIAWDWDLGTLFWIDRIVFRTSDFLLRTLVYGSNLPHIRTHSLSVSDGRRTLTGAVDYEELFVGDAASLLSTSSEFPGQVTYLFAPRPVRFIAAEWISSGDGSFQSQSGFLIETLVYATGHVAQVEVTSDFIDLGRIDGDNRVKVIDAISWVADLPEGAYIQARTRSGNSLQEIYTYFRKDGTEVTKEQYDQMPNALRGPTESVIGAGTDWSEWSNFYQRSGERFRSPSPRRYLQIQLILGSDRPETAPTVHSMSIGFTDAFLSGVQGEIQPRMAEPGVEQLFSYRIVPLPESRDTGFDRILLRTPSPVVPGDLVLRIDGDETVPASVSISQDSLFVELPRTLRHQEVELTFSSILKDNATLFKAFVGSERQPEIWQPVDPLSRSATTVYLPSVAGSSRLIAGLTVRSIISPNGDGVGDEAEIRFQVLKTDAPAKVQIYALDGRLVRDLEGHLQPDQSYLFSWTGFDQGDNLVPPGVYLCKVSVEAQTGTQSRQHLISVAY